MTKSTLFWTRAAHVQNLQVRVHTRRPILRVEISYFLAFWTDRHGESQGREALSTRTSGSRHRSSREKKYTSVLTHTYVYSGCNYHLPSSHYIMRNAQTFTAHQGEVAAEKHENFEDVVTIIRPNFREEKCTTANAQQSLTDTTLKTFQNHILILRLTFTSADRLVIAYLQLFQRKLIRNGSSPSRRATQRSGVGSSLLTTLSFN